MNQYGFGKQHRLLKPRDFNHLRAGSQYVTNHYFKSFFKQTLVKNSEQTRVGFSISKKVGNAVFRNKLKRILREEFRLSSSRNDSLDILIITSPRIKKLFVDQPDARNEVSIEFEKIFKKINKKISS